MIEQSGSAKADFFGFDFKEDGLFLQQDPEEYAAFVTYMVNNVPPASLSLDIGTAAGGQTKFLRDYFSAGRTIVVDDGQHADFAQWRRIKPLVNSEIVLEIIGDSHAPSTREKLMPYRGQVDVAFVDGDHSYRGLRKDIFLTKELLKPGGYMILHDTTTVRGLRRVFEELLDSSDFELFRNFANRFGISVWKMMRVKRMPNAINRALGIGRI
ncbi:MAG: class I SAM-dependent methyltransferase [Planctomycetia bacterium]|nr:class I SAM-dependent methyltransferase [Planctomycetia bacterium]